MSLIPRNFYLDDVFNELERGPKGHPMRCDIYEANNNYHIDMEVAGYRKDEVSIECEDGLLTVTAEKKVNNDNEANRKYIKRERFYEKLSRSFNFSDIDEDRISAEFRDGILRIVIPKLEKRDNKRVININ